jgi:hypothetical protein
VKQQIERYQEEKNSISGFREALSELPKQIALHDGKPKQVVFFIDELDRCRPDFAISLLERIKHLFTVDNFIFVLALDREQLRNIIKTLYGTGQQADSYLRRFIDFSYKLEKPSIEAFAELLKIRFGITDLFSTRKDGATEIMRLLPAFVDTANWLNLDLRTQEQCFTRINAIARLWPTNQFLPTDALCVLVGLRVGYPEKFEVLRSTMEPLNEFPHKEASEGDEFPLVVETTLEAVFMKESSYETKAQKMRPEYGVQQWGRDRKTDLFFHLYQHRKQLMRLIEFSAGFQ